METVQEIEHAVFRYGEFIEATQDLRLEFQIWKFETSLSHVKVDVRVISISKLTFMDWLTWRIQNELNEVTEEITEDAQFEEIAIC